MANRLTDLNVEFVSLVDRAAVRNAENPTEPQRFLVWKADETPNEGGPVAEIDEVRDSLEKAERERDEALEATQKAEKDQADLNARIAELEKAASASSDDDEDEDDLNKADLSEPVRKRLEKAEADAAAANERIAKAEEMAKSEREIRVTREFVAKADEFKALPFKASEFGPVLKSASEKLTKDEYEELSRVLKAADEQIAKSELFKEAGRSGEPQSSDAQDALTQKAEEIRKADPSLSEYEVLLRAGADRDVQARYLDIVR